MIEFLSTLVVFVFVIGVLVFVHELGHFLAARLVGIRVEEFAIGMGPKVCGFSRNDTEYNIRLLPIGGFVKMFGEGDYDNLASDSYGGKSPLQRLFVLVAGVMMNVLLAIILLYVQGFNLGFEYRVPDGYFKNEYRPWFGEKSESLLVVQEVKPSSPLSGKIDKLDILTKINGEDYSLSNWSEKAIKYSGQQINLTFVGYASDDIKNVVIQFPELSSNLLGQNGGPLIVISGFTEDSVLEGKVQPGAIIKYINGKSYEPDNFVQTISSFRGQNIKLTVLDSSGNNEREIEIYVRDQERPLGIILTTTLSPSFLFGITTSPISLIEFKGLSVWFAGFAQALNNIQYFGFAISELLQISVNVGSALPLADNVSGAVGLFGILDRVLKEVGFWGIIELMILFSINLAVINMLPIPALDGGHVLFTLVELITRKRLNTKWYNYLTLAGFALLLFLMIVITYLDIIRFTSLRKIFCNESREVPFVCDLSYAGD
ncbi:MAG: zinc metalloprotease [Candidatus Dojkabacteria bacterium]|nr:MAG: zinc metalloprotease [Candidatus Dojkabacteria bacterium]